MSNYKEPDSAYDNLMQKGYLYKINSVAEIDKQPVFLLVWMFLQGVQ